MSTEVPPEFRLALPMVDASVAKPAAATAYRLPFWHYTTPLVGKPNAARWVLPGTFLYR